MRCISDVSLIALLCCKCGVSYVAYAMFHLLHEMLPLIAIKVLCDFIYVNLLKQLIFC